MAKTSNSNGLVVGIITYDHNHLKTEQVVNRLVKKHYNIIIYSLPFYKRPPRTVTFAHRPEQSNGSHPMKLAQKYGFEYVNCSSDLEIDDRCDYYLVTGAGILSESCVKNKKILNCHPGLLPMSRGLDSFKWAILDFVPVGNTLHFIDENIDAGEIVFQSETALYENDTIETFAARHYDCEIEMLADFESYVTQASYFSLQCEVGIVHKRMPLDVEKQMLASFEKYKKQFARK